MSDSPNIHEARLVAPMSDLEVDALYQTALNTLRRPNIVQRLIFRRRGRRGILHGVPAQTLPEAFDWNNGDCLRVVAHQIAASTLDQAQALRTTIKTDQEQVAFAHKNAEAVYRTMAAEYLRAASEEARAIAAERRDQAEAIIKKLEAAQLAFQSEINTLDQALAPITESLANLIKVAQVGDSIHLLKSAEAIAEAVSKRIEDRRAEFEVLNALSARANAQLLDIADTVRARESGILEIETLAKATAINPKENPDSVHLRH